MNCDAVVLPVPDRYQARLGPEHGNEKPQLALGERQPLDFRLRCESSLGERASRLLYLCPFTGSWVRHAGMRRWLNF